LDPVHYFYEDVPEDMAKKAISLLQRQAWNVNFFPQTYAPWKDLPSAYIITTKDEAIPMQFQEMFSAMPGGQFTVEKIESSHSPFLSKPEETAAFVEKYATKFAE
jgi:hypothetical protein